MHPSFNLSLFRSKSQESIDIKLSQDSRSQKGLNDRFLPSKASSEIFEFHLTKTRSSELSEADSLNDHILKTGDLSLTEQNLANYTNLLETNLINSTNPILSYQSFYNFRKPYNLLDSKYDKNLLTINKPNKNVDCILRKVSKQPFKILDAPGLQDDFYLNLLDWSSRNLIAIALENSLYTWSFVKNEARKVFELPSSNLITSLSWNSSGETIAIGEKKGYINIYDIETKKIIQIYKNHDARVSVLAWNGSTLVSGSRDRNIVQIDSRDNCPINKLIGHKQEICGLKWDRDFQYLASGGNDNKVFIWNLKSPQPIVAKFSDHTAAVKALSWSPHQSNLLATGGGSTDKTIKFWNVNTLKCIQSVNTGAQVCNMCFSPNVNEIVTTHGFSMNHISLWKYPDMKKIVDLTGHSQRVLYLALCSNGEDIVTGSGDETLRFWKIFPKKKDELNYDDFYHLDKNTYGLR